MSASASAVVSASAALAAVGLAGLVGSGLAESVVLADAEPAVVVRAAGADAAAQALGRDRLASRTVGRAAHQGRAVPGAPSDCS